MPNRRATFLAAAMLSVSAAITVSFAQQQDRATKVLGDRDKVQRDGFWIYNDLTRGYEEARKSGKPLLVTFRCIPCEHCAQFDERVVERDPAVLRLLEQFVCVRVVHANGMDLSLFQFDYDQSWSAFFLNADQTIYGRYGTRSHRTEADDMSLPGFSQALQGALELHRGYPGNKSMLAAKRGPAALVRSPEEYGSLQGKYGAKLDYTGKVVQSCIHCHQVGEAQRLSFRSAGKPIPEALLFPYPHPKILGLGMDAATRATIKMVAPGSVAEQAGFLVGDRITALAGQPILSMADLQWVLHNAPSEGTLRADIRRGAGAKTLTVPLASGWRRRGDIAWRATSWDMRRMVTGGLVLEELAQADRAAAGIADGTLALRVKHVGQYGAHAAAKQAGVQQGDIVVAVDGRSQGMTEGELLTTLVNGYKVGDRVPFTLLRRGQRVTLSLPMQ